LENLARKSSQIQSKLFADLIDYRKRWFLKKKEAFKNRISCVEDTSEVGFILNSIKRNLNDEMSFLSLSLLQKSNF
jgi:hypothetical protein